jgi:putative glutamine amidotransferase
MMKRIILFLVALYLLNSCAVKQNEIVISIEKVEIFSPTIVLMHPTVNNLKTFISLTEQDIFPFPKEANVLGVYHTKGAYDYGQSIKFLGEVNDARFGLLGLNGELSPQNIYGENEFSDAFKTVFENSQGVIFFGGPDIPPATYGNPTNLLTEITDVYRHYLELSFLFHLLGGNQDVEYVPLLDLNPDYSILGICLGMQSMNVATGGTMIQDIPTELYGLKTIEDVLAFDENMRHRNYNTNFGTDNGLTWGHLHQIKFEEGSILESLNGNSSELPYIWSSHHQALNNLGKDLVPIAWSLDGKIVEAIRHSKYPNVLGVQFHPEVPSIYDSEKKLLRIPFEQNPQSYIDLHPNEKGEDFHRAFWKMVGDFYKD